MALAEEVEEEVAAGAGQSSLTASSAAFALYAAPEGEVRSAPLWMCISYTSRSLALVRLHSRVMPSRLAGSRLTAAAKAHAPMPARLDHGGEVVGVVLGRGLEELVRHGDAYL